jgi:hypothetical protein
MVLNKKLSVVLSMVIMGSDRSVVKIKRLNEVKEKHRTTFPFLNMNSSFETRFRLDFFMHILEDVHIIELYTPVTHVNS